MEELHLNPGYENTPDLMLLVICPIYIIANSQSYNLVTGRLSRIPLILQMETKAQKEGGSCSRSHKNRSKGSLSSRERPAGMPAKNGDRNPSC